MKYEAIKDTLFTYLKVPRGEPDPPAGSPDSVQTFRAAPNFLRLRIVVTILVFAAVFVAEFVLLIAGAISAQPVSVVLGILAMLVTAVVLPMAYLLIRIDYDLRYYIVTDRSLRIRQGALIIEESTLTYANVQNLKVHQGPLERWLGISNLVVQTAGGSSPAAKGEPTSSLHHRGVLRGVANAVEVRDLILSLLRKYRDAGLGDPEERRHASKAASRGSLAPVAVQRLQEIRTELQAIRTSTTP